MGATTECLRSWPARDECMHDSHEHLYSLLKEGGSTRAGRGRRAAQNKKQFFFFFPGRQGCRACAGLDVKAEGWFENALGPCCQSRLPANAGEGHRFEFLPTATGTVLYIRQNSSTARALPES